MTAYPPVLPSFKSKDLPSFHKTAVCLGKCLDAWLFSQACGFLTFILNSEPWTLQGFYFLNILSMLGIKPKAESMLDQPYAPVLIA